MNKQELANGLGWLSIGVGLAEVVAPNRVAQLIGVNDTDGTRALLRFYGFREIAAGVGILSQPRPAQWMWGRVAGDLLDLASLASALRSESSDKTKLGAATAAVLGVTALDVYCAQRLSNTVEVGEERDNLVRVTKSTIVNRPAEEVYRFWRNFEQLPQFMSYLESVEVISDGQSRWKAKAPGGMTVEWTAEIVDDLPGSRIAWRSLEDSDIQNAGAVSFERAPGGRGTLIRVQLEYAPPGGGITAKAAKLFGQEPGQQIEADLRRLKQILETGEVVNSDASIHRGLHPAQPHA